MNKLGLQISLKVFDALHVCQAGAAHALLDVLRAEECGTGDSVRGLYITAVARRPHYP